VPAESVVVRRVAFAHVESRYSGDMATTAPGRGVPSLRRSTPDTGADKVSVCAMGSGHAAVQGARMQAAMATERQGLGRLIPQ